MEDENPKVEAGRVEEMRSAQEDGRKDESTTPVTLFKVVADTGPLRDFVHGLWNTTWRLALKEARPANLAIVAAAGVGTVAVTAVALVFAYYLAA